MPLVPVKCANCGASLTLDEVSVGQLVECPYCHTSLTFERQPDNTFVTSYEIGHADTVIVQDSNSIENRLANAETYLNVHRSYGKAAELFAGIIDDASAEWRAWWGYVRARTGDLSSSDFTHAEFEELSGRVRSALAVAPADQRAQIESEWRGYTSRFESARESLRRSLDDADRDLSRASSDIRAADERIGQLRQRMRELEQREEELKAEMGRKNLRALEQERVAQAPVLRGCLLVIVAIVAFDVLVAGLRPSGDLFMLIVLFAIPPALLFAIFNAKKRGTLAVVDSLEAQRADLERQRSEVGRLMDDEEKNRQRLIERRVAAEAAKSGYEARL